MPAAQSPLDRANALIQRYERGLRRFLQDHVPAELISQLDNERTRVNKAISQDRRTPVCFIGESGIGKSTLLNALVAQEETVVPSGGIGPLTALATEVGHNEIPRFRAEYHPRAHFWRFAAALRFHAARLHAQGAGMPPPDVERGDVRQDLEQEVSQLTEPDGRSGPSRIDDFISTAKLSIVAQGLGLRESELLETLRTLSEDECAEGVRPDCLAGRCVRGGLINEQYSA